MAIHTVPVSAVPVTRADLIRTFYAIRKAEVAVKYPGLRDYRVHDFARAWAELDADAEMARIRHAGVVAARAMKAAA